MAEADSLGPLRGAVGELAPVALGAGEADEAFGCEVRGDLANDEDPDGGLGADLCRGGGPFLDGLDDGRRFLW